MSRFFLQKIRDILIILHLSLVCVFNLKITFILGRREQARSWNLHGCTALGAVTSIVASLARVPFTTAKIGRRRGGTECVDTYSRRYGSTYVLPPFLDTYVVCIVREITLTKYILKIY
jgi:hypothetical protein